MSLFEALEYATHLGQPCPVTGIKRGDCTCHFCTAIYDDFSTAPPPSPGNR